MNAPFGFIDQLPDPPPTSTSERPRSGPLGFRTAAAFCAEFEPLSYCLEGIVRSGSLYTLTASTGSGKTALLIDAGLAIATGRGELIGIDVERGRVAYLAFENADDVRMRLLVTCHLHGIDLSEVRDDFVILDRRAPPEQVFEALQAMTSRGPFTAIVVDTLQAAFDGRDFNDNVASGEFMRRLRNLTKLRGAPSVIVAAHPVKGASQDNLIPYGGGAMLNEVDGNLTLSRKDGGLVSLYWQGKIRGLDFQPRHFRFDLVSCPEVLDRKGHQVLLPVLMPTSEETVSEKEEQSADLDRRLLVALAAAPDGSLTDWGLRIGCAKGTVSKRLQRLKGDKLVEKILDKWVLTARAKKILKGDE